MNSGTLIFLTREHMSRTVITSSANTSITSHTLACVVPTTMRRYRLHLTKARNCLSVTLESTPVLARRKLAVVRLSVALNCDVRSSFDSAFASARE